MGATTTPIFVPGIDVSHHNGQLNWTSIANSGVAFAFAKATEGTAHTDKLFAANWKGMKAAGIMRGAYHFFHPASAPEQQADFFISVVQRWEAGDLPPVLDVEETVPTDEWPKIQAADRVPLILRWLDRVEGKLGIRPIIYTRRGWVAAELPNPGRLGEYPLWVAAYTNAPKPPLPNGWATWTFWQYSETGKLQGINGNFDMDRFNGSPAGLAALAVPAKAADT